MKKPARIKFWFYLIYRILLVLALGLSIYYGDLLNILLCMMTMFLTFLPTLVERKWHVHYPTEFEFGIMTFIFMSLILGSVYSFYERYSWWDVFLHTISGVIIGLIGFSMVYILNKGSITKVHLSPSFIALFSFSFAISIGVIWEIYEYSMDWFLGWNMQRSGLNDTMSDLIVDSIGALAIAILGYLYLKGKIKFVRKYSKRFYVDRDEAS